ncbi:MAG: hypothetical protein AAGB30_14925 [Pedobacter sp.]|nr:hypothetical protein [Pedobacter sp.]
MRKNITIYLASLLSVLVLFNSCKKDYETIQNIDDAKIQAFTAGKGFTKDPSGYYYKITDPGNGADLKNSDSVFYSYNFKSLSGTVFNQSSNVIIPGDYLGYTDRFVVGSASYLFTPIREVYSKLKRGGKATLILPSYMAFGKNGINSSPVNIESNEIIVLDLGIYAQAKKHEINEVEIDNFVAANKLTLTKDPSRARYQIITPGTGTDAITLNSTITFNYTRRFLDGTVAESSTGGVTSSVVADLITGWQKILPGRVTAGGKLRLVLPGDLVAGTAMDFDIEIVSVTN